MSIFITNTGGRFASIWMNPGLGKGSRRGSSNALVDGGVRSAAQVLVNKIVKGMDVIWRKRILNQLSCVKIEDIPLNYVLSSDEDVTIRGDDESSRPEQRERSGPHQYERKTGSLSHPGRHPGRTTA